MNLCEDGHEEVCHETRRCPACEIKEDLQGKIDDLNDKVESLEQEVESLSAQ